MKMRGILFFIKEFFWGGIYAAVLVGASFFLAGVLIYFYWTPNAPGLKKYKLPESTVIYDRKGEHVLYKIHGEENRKVVTHNEISNKTRMATIAAEDKSFYEHNGIDVLSILRALKFNVENSGIYQGGSTITQQLVRNVYLNREKTFIRKFIETVLALRVERRYSKEQILDFYLNGVPYGSNAYGIQAAAETFFKKNAKDLTLDESAFLAALPKAPTHFSPYGPNRKELILRQKRIIWQMNNLGYISTQEKEEALKINTLEKVVAFKEPIDAPHFVFYAMEELENQYGRKFLETEGLKIYTTLDYDMQKMAEKAIREGVRRNLVREASNAALVAISPKTGEILAMVGSRDYFDEAIDGQVNVATSFRQPGSAFKPIVYATAFEKGYQPETIIEDKQTNFGPDGSGKDYIPRNYDGKFHGIMPIRKALAMSLNIPAVKTLSMVGIENAVNMGKRLGISNLSHENKYGLALAIGGVEVRPIDLTSAFSVFANDGKRNSAHAIKKIESKNYSYEVKIPKEEQALNPQIARKLNSILSDNEARTPIFGPRSPLYFPDKLVAAKTGTSQDFRDAWTVGYTPNIAVGIWVGNNDGRPMFSGSDGIFVAAPIWRSFMDMTLPLFPQESFLSYQKENVGKIKNIASEDAIERQKEKDNNNSKKDKKKKKKG